MKINDKEIDWLISDEDFNTITHNGDWDVYLFMLWDNGIVSPENAKSILHSARFQYTNADCSFCESKENHYELSDGRYKCKSCLKKFSITSGTYLDGTHLEYYHWFRFAHLVGKMKITNSVTIANDLGVTQATAFGMLNVLRKARKENTEKKFVNGQDVLSFNSYHDVLGFLVLKNKNQIIEPVADNNDKKEGIFSIDALKSVYKTSFKGRDIDNTPTLQEFIKDNDVTIGDVCEEKIKELGSKIETLLNEKASNFENEPIIVNEDISETIKEIEINNKKMYEFGK